MPTIRKFKNGLAKARPLSEYKKGEVIHGGGTMSLLHRYSYRLEENPGKGFDERFKPAFSPQEMLSMGVFEGKYLNDCTNEFPKEWFAEAFENGKLSPESPNISCNYFGIRSRQPLPIWIENGWAPSHGHSASTGKNRDMLADPLRNPDERGWFQWYCRYWLGRRIPDLDDVQISRWRSFARHAGAVKKGCAKGDLDCRPRERQALLQWAYDPFL